MVSLSARAVLAIRASAHMINHGNKGLWLDQTGGTGHQRRALCAPALWLVRLGDADIRTAAVRALQHLVRTPSACAAVARVPGVVGDWYVTSGAWHDMVCHAHHHAHLLWPTWLLHCLAHGHFCARWLPITCYHHHYCFGSYHRYRLKPCLKRHPVCKIRCFLDFVQLSRTLRSYLTCN